MIKLFRSAVLAGITIGVAGFGFLASGVQSQVYGTLVGAILFSFGLLTVLGYKLALYTGTAGFIKRNELLNLLIILSAIYWDVWRLPFSQDCLRWICRLRLRISCSCVWTPVQSDADFLQSDVVS